VEHLRHFWDPVLWLLLALMSWVSPLGQVCWTLHQIAMTWLNLSQQAGWAAEKTNLTLGPLSISEPQHAHFTMGMPVTRLPTEPHGLTP
jgi:hypothetical protein